jgi:multiple sugar transport system substrate-binding protein
MKNKIIGPDDPALAVLQQQLIDHPEWETELVIVPWAEYQPMMESSLMEETSSYQAVCVPGHIWLPGLVSNNWLADFDSLLPEIDPIARQTYQPEDIILSVANECKLNGKQYILPLFTDGHLIFYRKDLLNLNSAADVPIINPFDLPQILEKNTKIDDIFPFALKAHPSEILLDWLPYLWAAGGKVWDSQKQQPLFNSPEAVKALEFYVSLKSFCPKNTHTFGNQEISDYLKSGRVMMAASWGGQAALILDEGNPYRDLLGTALFTSPWNATWGISIPQNQPMERKVEILSTLFRAASPQQDREVTRVAGSPVRYSSYSDDQLSRYSWLETQQQMLNRCQMLPTDPKFSKYLGPLYEAVYQAFIGEISPAEALLKVARS